MNNHMLIAGASGTGKSFFLNQKLCELYEENSLFILIDPKKVELIDFAYHWKTCCFETESVNILSTLNTVCDLMDTIYDIMLEERVKNFSELVETKIYVVVEEFGDLVSVEKEVLKPLQRISQLGRAANINLILLTQRPEAKIMPNSIKDNILTRYVFRLPTAISSRVTLDRKGAEDLSHREYLVLDNGKMETRVMSEQKRNTVEQESEIQTFINAGVVDFLNALNIMNGGKLDFLKEGK